MKTLFCTVCLIFLNLLLFPAKIIPLPELLKPELIQVDDTRLYVVEKASIYMYSLKDFKLLKKFGKQGEGPREFMTGGMTLGQLWLSVQPDALFLHSMNKISFFTREGEFIKEKKAAITHTPVMHPLGKGFVGPGFLTENKIKYWTFNIYDENLENLKELYRYERAYYQGRDIDILAVKTPDFALHHNKIYIADTIKTGAIRVFDHKGNKLDTLHPPYPKVTVTAADKKRILGNFAVGRRKAFYEQNKTKLKFPATFPAMRFMHVSDGKIYLMTYKRKEDKTLFLILDTKGKLPAETYLPVTDLEVRYYCPYTIRNNKLYHLYDNGDTEQWELLVTGIQ